MFEKKTIIVTGASKGIGREISRALAREGANLALVARGVDALADTRLQILEEIPSCKVEIFPCDITDSERVRITVEAIVQSFGSIDACISNAGYSHPQYFDQTPIVEFEKQIQTNYLGAVYLLKFCKPHLKAGSFIAVTSSVLGYMGCFGYSSYGPSKYAVLGLAETLRQEFAFDKIQVSVLCPPDTLTPGYQLENVTKPKETLLLSEGMKALDPEEVAAIFLKGLKKGKFIINCNLESEVIFRFKLMAPEAYYKVIMSQLKKIKKDKLGMI
ncbi:MAG: SDR family oxidoreductase [Oligoflexus sp.]|nr:SDR family oxidoreductase [Oligoflexus sp.]